MPKNIPHSGSFLTIQPGFATDIEIDSYRTITENAGLAVIRKITESYKREKEENPFGNSSLVNSCAFVPDYRTFIKDFKEIVYFIEWHNNKQ